MDSFDFFREISLMFINIEINFFIFVNDTLVAMITSYQICILLQRNKSECQFLYQPVCALRFLLMTEICFIKEVLHFLFIPHCHRSPINEKTKDNRSIYPVNNDNNHNNNFYI